MKKSELLIPISYPKASLTSRTFGIQHPKYYHDIVYWIIKDWEFIINHLFNNKILIYSYSFPIPLNSKAIGNLSPLRAGRLIYEWIEMAEKDLIAEAHNYKYIIHTDITNFYNSIYTHSISWALHGRKKAFNDVFYNKNKYTLTGNKIDKLIQYANDKRTNGIPIGSALSDLISEIILARIDKNISIELKKNKIKFIATRFKDDYRFLCNSEEEKQFILKTLGDKLAEYNLLINEHKTKVGILPEGLYRTHIMEYNQYSLKEKGNIPFKTFEFTLLKALDIHKRFPGTSILEKFLGELFNSKYELKINYSTFKNTREKQILKTLSLLMLLKRESQKTICHVISIIDYIYNKYNHEFDLDDTLKRLILKEIKVASEKESIYEIIWLIYFAQHLDLCMLPFILRIYKYIANNTLLESILKKKQLFFKDRRFKLFTKLKKGSISPLAKEFDVFKGKN